MIDLGSDPSQKVPKLYTNRYYNELCCTEMYCTVLYCTVLYCTVLYCTVLYCTVLYFGTVPEGRGNHHLDLDINLESRRSGDKTGES